VSAHCFVTQSFSKFHPSVHLNLVQVAGPSPSWPYTGVDKRKTMTDALVVVSNANESSQHHVAYYKAHPIQWYCIPRGKALKE